MLRRIIKLVVSLAVHAFDVLAAGLRRLVGREPDSRLVILYYHAVSNAHRHLFEWQMEHLVRAATPVALDGKPVTASKPLRVAVTFDDGFESVVQNALPVLRRLGIPMVQFFPTGSWGSRPSWVRNPAHPSYTERVLGPDELRTLASDPLVTIGSHSITHPRFPDLPPEVAMQEFAQSKSDLESVLQRPVELFSFPHGAHTAPLLAQARTAGYRRVFTVNPECLPAGTEAFSLGRIAVDPDDWPIEFMLKIRGAYRWNAKRPTV
ncbi:MAG: polysaccharide deacetylase family protein [Limisphaerales bacterium]